MPIHHTDHPCRPAASPAPTDPYPAVHHFRVIVTAAAACDHVLAALLQSYDVTAPLLPGSVSSGGRYRSLQVSVRLKSRDEHVRLDHDLRNVEGVRILL